MPESVKDILIRRDNMSSSDADELIAEFEADLDDLLDNGGILLDAEQLVMDYFGLEPDYLMEFLTY